MSTGSSSAPWTPLLALHTWYIKHEKNCLSLFLSSVLELQWKLRKQKDAAAVSPSPAGRNTQAIAANFTAQLSTCIQGSWLNKQRPRCAPRARRVTRDHCEINLKRTEHLWASALSGYTRYGASVTPRALKRTHLCTCLLISPRLNYAPTQSVYWLRVGPKLFIAIMSHV